MVIYNPTDSRFLTLAQTRTNNGTKDVKLILDRIDKVFYTLDDDGNFDAVDNETAATIVELSVGTLKGDDGSPIILEDSFEKGNGTFDLDAGDKIQIGYSDANGDGSTRLAGGISIIENTFEDTENEITYYTKLDLNASNGSSIIYNVGSLEHVVEMTESGGVRLVRYDSDNDILLAVTLFGSTINIIGLPAYDDVTAAVNDDRTSGDLFITTGDGASPLNVAGIVMMVP